MEKLLYVCKKAEVQPGRLTGMNVEGKPIVVYQVDGLYRAVSGVCPHQQLYLAGGYVVGCTIVCPNHFWKFDAKTGDRIWPLPQSALRPYKVVTMDDDVFVAVIDGDIMSEPSVERGAIMFASITQE